MRRRFNATEKFVMHANADGLCQACGIELNPGWHADHVIPHSKSGRTDIANAQALCSRCNLQKGSKIIMTQLRPWQQEALDAYLSAAQRDFLAVACPGAGKTTWALTVSKILLDRGTISRVIVVVPSDALRTQWSDHTGAGIDLRPFVPGDPVDKHGFHGIVTTYQAIATSEITAFAIRNAIGQNDPRRTLVILDEIHHAADGSAFGQRLEYAFEFAARRLSLTGTPWRTDSRERMPFVQFDQDGMLRVDYSYDYGRAVDDGVCRPMHFAFTDGFVSWVGLDGELREEELTVNRGLTGTDRTGAMAALLDATATGHWIEEVILSAHADLMSMRSEIPDAAGLIVAKNRYHAQQIREALRRVTGVDAPVVVSGEDEGGSASAAREAIESFRDSNDPWIIAVKMIAEGVDIPRLLVGVYATNVTTAMFFNQVVGRFVRVRPNESATARMYVAPSVELKAMVEEIEAMLPQRLAEEADRQIQSREGGGNGAGPGVTPLGSESLGLGLVHTRTGDVAGESVTVWSDFFAQNGIPTHYATNAAQSGASVPQVPQAKKTPKHRLERELRDELKILAGRAAHHCLGDHSKVQEVNLLLIKMFNKTRDRLSLHELEAACEFLRECISTGVLEWPKAS